MHQPVLDHAVQIAPPAAFRCISDEVPIDIGACWLVTDQPSNGMDNAYVPEKHFVSFLNGRQTPFFWHDSFVSDAALQRTYFGWEEHPFRGLKTSYTQPLPLYGTVDAIKHCNEALPSLPALFDNFIQQFNSMRITWILNPLWMATSGMLEDHFALACLSLERLASAWEEKKKPELIPKTQARVLRKAVTNVVNSFASELSLDEKQQIVLEKNIARLCEAPNADKLTTVFTELGIQLSDDDIGILISRNAPLHGRRTLLDTQNLEHVDAEVWRCWRLHHLIVNAILRVLNYRGPIMNYANFGADRVEWLGEIERAPN